MNKRRFVVMAKPVGSRCSMRCRYCYYLDKGKYSSSKKQSRMSFGVLERIIKQTMEASEGPAVSFVWHGGEPTLAGIDFYEKALELERKYLPKGFEVWTSSDAGTLAKDLSRALLSEIKSVGISSDRGVKFGTQASPLSDYTVNRLTEMPSCILEMGFITSETDTGLFDENLNAYAEAVARAVESLYPNEK